MAEIRVKDNESLDSALRRFKRQCARAGVLNEVRKREHYEKPSVKRNRKCLPFLWKWLMRQKRQPTDEIKSEPFLARFFLSGIKKE